MADKSVRQRSSCTDDEKLAMEFLTGPRIRENGREMHRYLKPGTDEELKARAAFTRLLWQSDLNENVRNRLMILFNPFAKSIEPRELIFRHRSRGKRPDHVRDFHLASDVAHKVAAGMKLAVLIHPK
jgi:hypothetical protein